MAKVALIAGGGTGGHIYPAVAIARSLEQLDSQLKIHFAGSSLGLESTIVPDEGFPIHLVRVGRLNRNVSLWQRFVTLLTLPLALLKSAFLLLKLRPTFVLGVGGFASAPVVFMASIMGFRTFIWEANAYPGMANRLLSRLVDEGLVVFDEAKRILLTKRNKQVGMPVRKEIEKVIMQSHPIEEFRIFIFGGSQGARDLNTTISTALAQSGEWLRNVKIVHQTGAKDHSRIKAIYDQLEASNGPLNVECHDFIQDMARCYAWADLVICRAGISTVAELAACGKAAILVPFPFASDDHQQKKC